MNRVSTPFLEESAVPEVMEAVGLGVGAALFLPGVDKVVFGAAKMAAKAGWGATKLGAKGVWYGAKAFGAAGSAVAGSKTAGVVGRAAGGAAVGAVGNLAMGVGGAAVATGWGVAKGLVGLGTDVAKTAVGPFVGSRWGGLVGLGLVGGVGVGAAILRRNQYGTDPAYAVRSNSIADVMQGMNATGDVVLGLHNRR